MLSTALLLTLVAPYFLNTVVASPCIVQDANWNLLAFGFNGKDYSLGTQDAWANGKATEITANGRPPFDVDYTVCYLSQFQNAIYVTNGDKSNPTAVHIYDATAKSWSTQMTSVSGTFNPTQFTAILDHDTNVFYALSTANEMFSLDMSSLKASSGNSIQWTDVKMSPYGNDYKPVMALAQNHIHFLDVPSAPAGDAAIFVIHFAYFQPDTQGYPVQPGGGTFPKTHGQTASLFVQSGVQPGFAFIPDDPSHTYVVSVESNTTQLMAPPPIKDSKATYFAGPSSIIQCASNGAVSYIAYNGNDAGANSAAQWASIKAIPSFGPTPGTSSSGGSSGGSGNGNNTGSGNGNGNSNSSSGGSSGNGTSSAETVAVGAITYAVPAVITLALSAFALV